MPKPEIDTIALGNAIGDKITELLKFAREKCGYYSENFPTYPEDFITCQGCGHSFDEYHGYWGCSSFKCFCKVQHPEIKKENVHVTE